MCRVCADKLRNTNLLQSDIGELHNTLNAVCEHLRLDKPKPLLSIHNDTTGDTSSIAMAQAEAPVESNSENHEPDQADQADQAFPGCEVSPPGTPSAVQAPIDTFLDITKLGSPGSATEMLSQGGNGAGSVRARRRSRPTTASQDLVSRGIISVADAEVLVDRYFTRIDSYLYGICSRLRNIQLLRTAHPILFAAICTVSAINDPQNQALYEVCNREFRRLVTQSLFEKHDLEYVRALCITGFYLADASRILLSDAVRRSADVHLHRSFGRLWSIAPKMHSNSTSPTNPSNGAAEASAQAAVTEMRDRVRLWYLQFICDQHLSILYNRDPLLRSDTEIAISCEAYLRRDDINDTDVRIVSQVSLLRIMSQIRDILGSDLETRVPQTLANQVAYYSRQLDKWFTRFSALFKPDQYVGDFPRRGLQLHFQFSKLYLGHQVFKGLQGDAIPPPFMPAASMAHDAAISIFEMILYEEVLQASLVGMPHYFLIMLAFAGHFLIEVTKTYSVQLGIVPEENLVLIRKVLTLFQNIPCVTQHPICRMTPGLNKKLMDCAASLSTTSPEILSTNPDPVENRATGVGAAGDLSSFIFPGDPLVGSMDDVLLTDFGEFTFPEMLNMMP